MQAILLGLRTKWSITLRSSALRSSISVSSSRSLSAAYHEGKPRKPEEPGPEDCCQVVTEAVVVLDSSQSDPVMDNVIIV